MNEATRAAEMAARDSYGRLLAIMSARTGDIVQAEDALASAFAAALETWPEKGVPKNPEAWLVTVARNRTTDLERHNKRFQKIELDDNLTENEKQADMRQDQRLALMLVCTHPAIASDMHTPLILQTVLGIEAKDIAKLFVISPAALAKRLGRTKAKIKDAGIPFAIPDPEVLAERVGAIFEAVYGAHALDWFSPSDRLGDEAFYLADLLTKLLPDHAEAFGLAALIAFTHARRNARLKSGVLVPTPDQDFHLWDERISAYARNYMSAAFAMGKVGRFQLEAAIQSVHMARAVTGKTDWPALEKLYFALIKTAPSVGAFVAQAAVTAEVHGAKAGLEHLEKIEREHGSAFQPLWAARADMLAKQGAKVDAHAAYQKAISLTTDTPLLLFLQQKQQSLLDA